LRQRDYNTIRSVCVERPTGAADDGGSATERKPTYARLPECVLLRKFTSFGPMDAGGLGVRRGAGAFPRRGVAPHQTNPWPPLGHGERFTDAQRRPRRCINSHKTDAGGNQPRAAGIRRAPVPDRGWQHEDLPINSPRREWRGFFLDREPCFLGSVIRWRVGPRHSTKTCTHSRSVLLIDGEVVCCDERGVAN
jgi:hypothetical protein